MAVRSPAIDLVSTDLFDTVLLRDMSLQTRRFAEIGSIAARHFDIDPRTVGVLRQTMHEAAYRATAIEAGGDGRLSSIWAAAVAALGLHPAAVRIFHEAELSVDIRHLAPNRKLLAQLDDMSRGGKRVIALSDTYYSAEDLRRIIAAVVGPSPIARIYASADLGLTKHAGGAFAEVARQEGVEADRILHIGDDGPADVEMARAAGWSAVHLPRTRGSGRTSRAIVAGFSALSGFAQGPRRRAWH